MFSFYSLRHIFAINNDFLSIHALSIIVFNFLIFLSSVAAWLENTFSFDKYVKINNTTRINVTVYWSNTTVKINL